MVSAKQPPGSTEKWKLVFQNGLECFVKRSDLFILCFLCQLLRNLDWLRLSHLFLAPLDDALDHFLDFLEQHCGQKTQRKITNHEPRKSDGALEDDSSLQKGGILGSICSIQKKYSL